MQLLSAAIVFEQAVVFFRWLTLCSSSFTNQVLLVGCCAEVSCTLIRFSWGTPISFVQSETEEIINGSSGDRRKKDGSQEGERAELECHDDNIINNR